MDIHFIQPWRSFHLEIHLTYLIRDSQYVTLKLYASDCNGIQELKVYNHLNSINTPDHPGKAAIRKLLGHFQIDGPHGSHLCLIHEPLGLSLDEILDSIPNRTFPLNILKPALRQSLIAVDFLHAKAGLIHTGTYTQLHYHLSLGFEIVTVANNVFPRSANQQFSFWHQRSPVIFNI